MNNSLVPSLKPFLGVAKSQRVFGRGELAWDGRKLRLGSKHGRVLAAVEPDSKSPGMWRVRHGTKLTDMVNLSRAKDAAISIALAELNA
jgi:hypothetical protein